MTTKEQEKRALERIKQLVDSLGEDSYIGTAMEGVWEIAERNIELDAAFSLEGQQRILEKELEDGRQRITELDGLVRKQWEELDILRREAAEARRLAAKWKMPQEIYRQLVGILEERREKETRQMEETADRWADGIHADGMTWEDIRQQADSYKQHRKQAGICGNILRVLKKYEEEKEG